jgi:hypothetical protein
MQLKQYDCNQDDKFNELFEKLDQYDKQHIDQKAINDYINGNFDDKKKGKKV